eukprot:TRINITY_DN9665_c0_g1_i1.p1 TRINITY_DN9665_c0_g1~~TRINITY_DN9665_c0_g1_i1.p1  ORF type:complete len:383 (-),score=81.26 TRINITY_DN9665_c0_g1_i1:14-1162(-)
MADNRLASAIDMRTVIGQFRDRGSVMKLDDVNHDYDGLITLMKKNAWISVIELAEKCLMSEELLEMKLQYRLAIIYGMIRMKMFENALSEFNNIGDFDSEKYLYESYPKLYPDKQGTMIPFTMRLLKAELDMKYDNVISSLEVLLEYCKQHKSEHNTSDILETIYFNQLNNLSNNEKVVVPEYDEFSTWTERENRIILSIINWHIKQKEYPIAIRLTEKLLQLFPNDPFLLSTLGKINLHSGNIKKAEEIFDGISSNVNQESVIERISNLTNRAFLLFAKEEFVQCIEIWEEILTIDEDNVTAINNIGMCNLYIGNGTLALNIYEEYLTKDPAEHLHEEIVSNLFSLYELLFNNFIAKKLDILLLIKDYGKDNFNIDALKLN